MNPPAGKYAFERGNGTLHVKPNGAFGLTTIGANAQLCELDGRIVHARPDSLTSPCVVKLATHGETPIVTPNGAQQRRDNCGARATFGGTDTRATPACTNSAVTTSRKQFQRQCDAKNYGAAPGTLSTALSACDKTLDWLTAGRNRNDVASPDSSSATRQRA